MSLAATMRRWPQVGTDGTAMVEFALLAPVFVLIFAGVLDLGNAMYTQIRLESALAAGVNYALLPASVTKVTPANAATLASNIATLVTTSDPTPQPDATVVVNNGPIVTVTSGTAVSSGSATSVDTSYYCPSGMPPNMSWGSPVAYGSSCAGGGKAGQFVSVTASFNYTSFFPYSFVQNGTMTLGAAVQVQ